MAEKTRIRIKGLRDGNPLIRRNGYTFVDFVFMTLKVGERACRNKVIQEHSKQNWSDKGAYETEWE